MNRTRLYVPKRWLTTLTPWVFQKLLTPRIGLRVTPRSMLSMSPRFSTPDTVFRVWPKKKWKRLVFWMTIFKVLVKSVNSVSGLTLLSCQTATLIIFLRMSVMVKFSLKWSIRLTQLLLSGNVLRRMLTTPSKLVSTALLLMTPWQRWSLSLSVLVQKIFKMVIRKISLLLFGNWWECTTCKLLATRLIKILLFGATNNQEMKIYKSRTLRMLTSKMVSISSTCAAQSSIALLTGILLTKKLVLPKKN